VVFGGVANVPGAVSVFGLIGEFKTESVDE